MAKRKKKAKPVQLKLSTPERDTEVTIGGEKFTVTVKSAAGLDQVVAACERVYRACLPQEVGRAPMGFAGPASGGPDISGPSSPYLYGMDADPLTP